MEPLSAIIVGAGHRAMLYASYARRHPRALRIVGVADPLEYRQRQAAETFGIEPSQCWSSAEELAALPRQADAAINGTMDHQHVPTSLPLLEAGYDLLLEKPFATSEAEMWTLVEAARRTGRRVMICHVLRYAPFYLAIRDRVAAGEIGDVLNIQTTEHVSYHHMVVGFVRGKWRKRAASHSSMLMAKCCHDLDLITWMKSGVAPRAVASFGCNMQFRPERAPEGAGTHCLIDCPIERKCLYSARKHYLDHPRRWEFYVWDDPERPGETARLTLREKTERLKDPGNPFGRCVWKMDNDVVDHQSVTIEFEDGSTATHNMVGGAARASRSIHLIGTLGEIQGVFEDSKFAVRHIDPRKKREYKEQWVDVDARGDKHGAFGGHGGGDLALVADFVRAARGQKTSIAATRLEDSIYGHLIGFRADESMERGKVVAIDLP